VACKRKAEQGEGRIKQRFRKAAEAKDLDSYN
jgi:hypothetical protein